MQPTKDGSQGSNPRLTTCRACCPLSQDPRGPGSVEGVGGKAGQLTGSGQEGGGGVSPHLGAKRQHVPLAGPPLIASAPSTYKAHEQNVRDQNTYRAHSSHSVRSLI